MNCLSEICGIHSANITALSVCVVVSFVPHISSTLLMNHNHIIRQRPSSFFITHINMTGNLSHGETHFEERACLSGMERQQIKLKWFYYLDSAVKAKVDAALGGEKDAEIEKDEPSSFRS